MIPQMALPSPLSAPVVMPSAQLGSALDHPKNAIPMEAKSTIILVPVMCIFAILLRQKKLGDLLADYKTDVVEYP